MSALTWTSSRPFRGDVFDIPNSADQKSLSGLLFAAGRLVPVAAIMAAQSIASIHLMNSNSAFLDEATYLNAGHVIRAAWAQGGGPDFAFSTYFSGAPVIYPVLVSFFDSSGGLLAARVLSLLWMLAATALVYASARRLFGTAAGWFAAAIFAGTEATQFLGALATYDSMALALIALAAWIVIRSLHVPRPAPYAALYLAAPVMALANATKYASAAYDLAVFGVAYCLAGWRYGFRAALRVACMLAAITAALLGALLAVAGRGYLAGVTWTTLSRPPGTSPARVVIDVSERWVGIIALLAVISAVAVVFLSRSRGGWWRAGLLTVCAGAVLIAPVNQARIHTTVSLSKHVGFGAWFGAIAAGYLLGAVAGARWRDIWRFPVAFTLVALLALTGYHQAQKSYAWPNATDFVAKLRPLAASYPGPILVDDSQVPEYMLGDWAHQKRWYNMFYLRYRVPGTSTYLAGGPAYAQAVKDGYFSVIALDWGSQKAMDNVVAGAIHENRHYHYVENVGYFVIWRYESSLVH